MNNFPDDASREVRLNQILADYLQALEAGQLPDDASFLARHSEFADELRQFLAEKRSRDELAQPDDPATLTPMAEPNRVPPDSPTQSGLDAPTLIPGPAPVATPPGTAVGYFGDYELHNEIARGGMRVVFKARQSTLNRVVALKMILTGQLASDADVERFYAEAEAAATLDDPWRIICQQRRLCKGGGSCGDHTVHAIEFQRYASGENLALAAFIPMTF